MRACEHVCITIRVFFFHFAVEYTTIEQKLEKLLTSYVEVRGLTGIDNNKLQELLQSIEPDQRLEILSKVQNDEGSTALHIAALVGNARGLKYIFGNLQPDQHHLLVCLKDKQKMTAVQYSAKAGSIETIEQMLANLSASQKLEILVAQNNESRNAEMIARHHRHFDTANKLKKMAQELGNGKNNFVIRV